MCIPTIAEQMQQIAMKNWDIGLLHLADEISDAEIMDGTSLVIDEDLSSKEVSCLNIF